MKKQTENITLIGGGLVAWWLLTRKAQVVPTGNGGGVTTVPGLPQESGAAVGKIYDSYSLRAGSRVDDFWGNVRPNMKLIGRQVEFSQRFIDPQTAVKHFGLYGIEFGNWMNQQDRINFMFATLVTLSDMASVMGVAQNKMGLRQKLQLAFGARGKGGFAAAFYQPIYYLINLTKTQGAGTFAHEFGHALDEHLHLLEYGRGGMASGGATTSRQTAPGQYDTNSVEYLFEKVFECLYFNENGTPTQFYKEQAERSDYYRRREEVWARTFEHYIRIKFAEKGIVNRWASTSDPEQPPKALVLRAEPWIRKIIRRAFK